MLLSSAPSAWALLKPPLAASCPETLANTSAWAALPAAACCILPTSELWGIGLDT